MKPYKILTLLFALSLASCSGFLDEDNLGNTTADDHYKTKSGYEGLVNSVYSKLRAIYQPTPYIFCGGTDLFFGAHQEVPLGLTAYQTLTSSNSQVETLFKSGYEAIQIANMAIHYSTKTENFAELNTRIAEVRAIRAYTYFLLVQNFGDLSLVDKLVDKPITHFERMPAKDIYKYIITELTEVIAILPEPAANFGRVSKRAVQHILAKVYLTRGYEDYGEASDFADAARLADAAIAGQNLNLPFDDLFAYENDNNEEILWSIQYAAKSVLNDKAHNWDYPWGPLVQETNDGVVKKNILHPTKYLFTLFEDQDQRFNGTFLNIRTAPYVGHILNPKDTRIVYYYPRTVAELADTTNWRAEAENRKKTIITPINEQWWAGTNMTNFPALRKFDRVQTTDIQYTHDLYIARLGETYLIAAEAYLQANDEGTALARISTVRNRAGASSLSSINLDIILDERARELAGEGFRWLDLKRTGKLMEYTKERNPDIKALFDSGADPFLGANGNYKILRPIPLSAISLDSGDYPQNPAYN